MFQEFQLSHKIFNSVLVSRKRYTVIFVQVNLRVMLAREDIKHLAECRKRYKFLTGWEAYLITTICDNIEWICYNVSSNG